MIDLAKRPHVLTVLKNPTKFPVGSKDRDWAIAYTTEAFALLTPTAPTPVPPVVNLTTQQAYDRAIANAKDGETINLGPGEFSVTISKF